MQRRAAGEAQKAEAAATLKANREAALAAKAEQRAAALAKRQAEVEARAGEEVRVPVEAQPVEGRCRRPPAMQWRRSILFATVVANASTALR